jgi:hypothetical protein
MWFPHVTHGHCMYKQCEIALIPWDCLDDFVKKEYIIEIFPCKFTMIKDHVESSHPKHLQASKRSKQCIICFQVGKQPTYHLNGQFDGNTKPLLMFSSLTMWLIVLHKSYCKWIMKEIKHNEIITKQKRKKLTLSLQNLTCKLKEEH